MARAATPATMPPCGTDEHAPLGAQLGAIARRGGTAPAPPRSRARTPSRGSSLARRPTRRQRVRAVGAHRRVAGSVGSASLRSGRPRPHDGLMQIAFVLYPQFTALDIVGPFQTMADLPGVECGVRRRARRSGDRPHGTALDRRDGVVRRGHRAGRDRRAGRVRRSRRGPGRPGRRVDPGRAPADHVDDERVHRRDLPRPRRGARRHGRDHALERLRAARAPSARTRPRSGSSSGAR